MRWDQERLETTLPLKGHRPVADTIIGPSRRFRHPAVQVEIDRRVAIYTRQVEEHGRITWLPRRGTGQSA